MSKSKKLVFFGTEQFSVPALKLLFQDDWNVIAIVTKPDSKSGRGQSLQEPPVKTIAQRAGIKVLQPGHLRDIYGEIKSLKPELGVLVSYGKLVPQNVIELFPKGIINIHPSLLPKYRGPSPVEAAILNGDEETGVSLMKLTAGMDEGPVYAQEVISLNGDETEPSLSSQLSQIGAELLAEHLEEIILGRLEGDPQDGALATYTKLLKKEDGWVDFNEPAIKIERKVRAYLSFPRTRAKIHNQEVVITKSRVAKTAGDGNLVIPCKNSYLEVLELIAPSGRTVSGADFLLGYAKN